jgi:hypothetical protein
VSYTVDIVAGPVPESDREAWAALPGLREELYVHAGDPSPEMRELHDRLTERYPCICEDESGPWSDGPLINNFDRRMVILGLVYSRVDEVLPFIIQTAMGMGFTVFDPQVMRIYRPSSPPHGRRAGHVNRRWWQFWK